MKIFRGPRSVDWYGMEYLLLESSKKFPEKFKAPEEVDNPIQLVDDIDISKHDQSWLGYFSITANITKGGSGEREAVAHIVIEESDIVTLYEKLMQGKGKQMHKLSDLEDEISSHKQALTKIAAIATEELKTE